MKLRYEGTGTVRVEGAGEVSYGEVLELPDATARVLLEEQPQHWSVHTSAKPPGTAGRAGKRGGD